MTTKSLVSKLLSVTAVGVIAAAPITANATIHEMVAAFCSGGGKGVISASGFLEAPGVSGQSNPAAGNFAKPVIVSGVVVGAFPFQIGSSPAAKFPEGDTVLGPNGLLVSESQHPSALNCPKAANLP